MTVFFEDTPKNVNGVEWISFDKILCRRFVVDWHCCKRFQDFHRERERIFFHIFVEIVKKFPLINRLFDQYGCVAIFVKNAAQFFYKRTFAACDVTDNRNNHDFLFYPFHLPPQFVQK